MNIVRGESTVFAHLQNAATNASMVGSHCVMRAKMMVEGTDTRMKKVGALFNLKTKRLDMGGAKVTFNKINFVERGK